MEGKEEIRDFIRRIIDEDNKIGRFEGRVHTRFPPEPNGYLHIGHAKSVCLNYGIARDYGGLFNFRFDDTNPLKEEEDYVRAQIEDVKWLGADWDDRLYFASNYFDQMYEYAVQLVKAGKAYVDDLSAGEIHDHRGTLTTPGRESPHRNRSVEENLDLLRRMRAGEYADGEKVLRAKIDMAHPNLNMRDPVMYRILHARHHNTGDKWCIYPTYDWAHGLEDSIERITHSICTLEFEDHRPLYDWFLDELGVHHPRQIEFARLNLTYTVMSKRVLIQLVREGIVKGWDDPRLPTLRGLRRRGYSASAIRTFCDRVGVAKVNSIVDIEFLEYCVREGLNKTAPRYMGVLRPLRVVIENYPEGKTEEFEALNNPENPSSGTHRVPFSRVLYIEQDDFMEHPPEKYYRLAPGREVRFRCAYLVTCRDTVKKNGKVVELRCTVDPETRGGSTPDGRKVKSTIHWVSPNHAINAEVRLYEKLFTVKDPLAHEDCDFKKFVNPDSLEVLTDCKVEAALRNLRPLDCLQLERVGYFSVDPDTTKDHLVLNRTTALRDPWARIRERQLATRQSSEAA